MKANRAVLSQMGIGAHFAQEGIFEFGSKSWGPQPARLMMAGTACIGLALVVARETGGYKGGATGAEGMALSLQNFRWVVPYHNGAIRAFKDKGVWSEAAQKHHEGLIKRQQVLIDAWKRFYGAGPTDDTAFAEGWTKARSAALQKAGMEAVFE